MIFFIVYTLGMLFTLTLFSLIDRSERDPGLLVFFSIIWVVMLPIAAGAFLYGCLMQLSRFISSGGR